MYDCAHIELSMRRSNIAVESDIAASLSDKAAKENKTLYAFANESLRAVLDIYKGGGKLEDVYPSWFYTRIMHDLDSVPVPGNLLERMVKALYASDSDSLLKYWFEEGNRIGAYLRQSLPSIEGLSSQAKYLVHSGLLPLKRLEVEIQIRGEETNKIVVRLLGAGLSEESTECVERFVRGLIGAYSLRVLGSSITKGIIEVMVAK